MSSIPQLNYLMGKEAARVATENFRLTLQEALKEYNKIWKMYLDLVKKCEDNNFRSLHADKTEIIGQKNGNYKRTGGMYIDEQNITNSVHSMEDILPQCTLDLHSSMEESNEGNTFEKIRKDITFGSPILCRNNSNSRRSNSISSPSKSIVVNNNLSMDNEQENSDQVYAATSASSTTNVSCTILCNTPIKNKKWSRSNNRNVKRSRESKVTTPSSSLKKKNNLVSIRKKQTNKVPLQIINNVGSVAKSINEIDKNNSSKPFNIQMMTLPSNRKLKQTKLVFHKTKKMMELSNNLKSPNVSEVIKTNNSISNQDKIFKQATLTNSIGLKEKEKTNESIGNVYNRVEISEDTIKNNTVHIYTNAQIKNELILQQEYEHINPSEVHDPLNTSNESDSTFFSENDCDTNLNKNQCPSFDFNKTCISLLKNESESTNEHFKKGYINSLETEEKGIEIVDLEEPAEKKRYSKLENEYCNECERYGKKHCSHHKSIPHKKINVPTSSWNTLLPDSSSSTT